MEFYQKLYYKLFAVMANAADALEHNELTSARKMLIAAMQEAEDTVISAECN